MGELVSFIFDNFFFIIVAIVLLRFFQKAKSTGKLSGKKFHGFLQKIEELNEHGQRESHEKSQISTIENQNQQSTKNTGTVTVQIEPGIKLLVVIITGVLVYSVLTKIFF